MKADYVHKDSKTINDEIVSYKITMPLTNNEELQRIDNHYNELVDEFTKQFVKEKDMILAQRIMMNLRKENEQLYIENQKLKEKQKEFIEWLNNIVNNLEKEQTKRFNHSYQYKLNSFNDILSKYKEIIGEKDGKN